MSAFDYLETKSDSWEWAKGVCLAVVIGVLLAWCAAHWMTCEFC